MALKNCFRKERTNMLVRNDIYSAELFFSSNVSRIPSQCGTIMSHETINLFC